ncbi:MAG: glycosyltransferase family 2 protein [Bacteroidales bacterium]|nr:glycosyltransferase family 2 protein [Bacteroidales bacterium]
MNISVIIPTYNGADKIEKILQSLEKQTFQNFEIIVGIDGSTDNTKEILEKQSYLLRERLIIFEQENKGRAVIRNNAAKKAKSNLLVFFDDDMIPNENSIEKHYSHHLINKISILGGNQLDKYEGKVIDFLKFKEYLSKKWMSIYGNKVSLLRKDNLFVTAANFSISKTLFFNLGGFDERLTDAEDWDLSVRALEQGIDIYFDPENIAYHNDYVTCKKYILRQRQYLQAHKTLETLKPQLYSNKYKRNIIIKFSLFKNILFIVFANKFNVCLIDNFNIYKILPKYIRYKIYDIIVTGLGKIYINKNI